MGVWRGILAWRSTKIYSFLAFHAPFYSGTGVLPTATNTPGTATLRVLLHHASTRLVVKHR